MDAMRFRLNRRLHHGFALLAVFATLLCVVLAGWRPTSAQENDLVGDYTVAIARLQVPTDVANGSMAIGRWHISFLEDGTFTLERLDLGLLVSGSYTVDGENLTLVDESGLLSCSNEAAGTSGETEVETATYTFELEAGNLKFSPVDEPCALRRVILATNDFTVYVACLTVPFSEVTEATPEATPETTSEPRDEAATPVAGFGRDPERPTSQVEDQIDSLLSQLTSCWATGDPLRFLPLLSADFQGQFSSGSADENSAALANLQAAMQLPIVWERAGDVELTDENRAEAVVRTTAADQEEFVRYLFVLEGGEWRWDGSA